MDTWIDETLPEDLGSDTCSLPAEVTEYEIENDRTYHAYCSGKYWGANDGLAQDQELTCHNLWYETFGSHLVCPYDQRLGQILDLGTGLGLWASAAAVSDRHATVKGLDLSPIQRVEPSRNLSFVIDDMEKDFTCEENTYDLIHIRGLDGSIQDWPRLYDQCLRSLRPGGILEHAEHSHLFTSSDSSIPLDGAVVL